MLKLSYKKEKYLLKKGRIIWLTQENILGQLNTIPLNYTGDLKHIKKGEYIYIDDGNIALKVMGYQKKQLKTRVVIGGLLKEYKGVNIPKFKLSFKGLTEKDKQDINFCIENQIDYIAQSFVRKVSDGIMIARGDLGVSIPVYKVPIIQKEIIRKCRQTNKFAITATQMLESMTENYLPTRLVATLPRRFG